MAKDPAFLFYPNDWFGGTATMTLEQKGAYITLLAFQFNNKGMFSKEDAIALVGEENFGKISGKFQEKKGMFFNKRLRDEIEKRKQHSEHQRNNVMKRWEKRYYDGNTVVLPLGNGNGNDNGKNIDTKNGLDLPVSKVLPKGSKKRKQFDPPNEDQVRQYFFENGYKVDVGSKAFRYYQTNNWVDAHGSPVRNWKQKMIAVWFKDENKSPTQVRVQSLEEISKEFHENWDKKK